MTTLFFRFIVMKNKTMNSCTMVTVRKVGTTIIRGEDIQYMSVMWSVQRDQELDILHIRKQDIPRLMDRWIALVIVWPMDVQMMNCGPISIHIASSKVVLLTVFRKFHPSDKAHLKTD